MDSTYDELLKIKKLYDENVLTKDEYEIERQNIVNKMPGQLKYKAENVRIQDKEVNNKDVQENVIEKKLENNVKRIKFEDVGLYLGVIVIAIFMIVAVTIGRW